MKELTDQELRRVWNMLKECSYYSLPLNMNDTFGYACSESEDVDFPDMLAVTEIFEKYGVPGVNAWAAVKTDQDVIIQRQNDKYKAAKKEIEADRTKYYWLEARKAGK